MQNPNGDIPNSVRHTECQGDDPVEFSRQDANRQPDQMRTLRFSMALALVSLAVALLANHPAAAGEGSSTVEGKVTLEGKPLRSGRIFFHLKNDQFVGAKIKNGEYSVERVPAGKWRITVEGEGVPAKYSSAEKAIVVVEVVANAIPGSYDIKLAK